MTPETGDPAASAGADPSQLTMEEKLATWRENRRRQQQQGGERERSLGGTSIGGGGGGGQP